MSGLPELHFVMTPPCSDCADAFGGGGSPAEDTAPHRAVSGECRAAASGVERRLAVLTGVAMFTALAVALIGGWSAAQWQGLAAGLEPGDEGSTTRASTSSAPFAESEGAEDDPIDSPLQVDSMPDLPAPADTTVVRMGQVEVVDVGVSSLPLPSVLLVHRTIAAAQGQQLVMMLSRADSVACGQFNEALARPLMQRRLAGIRLVRVALEVFEHELEQMGVPTGQYPAFFLLDSQLRPRDAIHAGEWDDETLESMATVIGQFVRQRYDDRRYLWSPIIGGLRL